MSAIEVPVEANAGQQIELTDMSETSDIATPCTYFFVI